jgi:uncharacterized protein
VILDAHAHVHDPCESHLLLLDEAGVDRSVLLCTRVHPERSERLAPLRRELEALQARLAGPAAPADGLRPAL